MSSPIISIILPTYNGAKYISASIQSCLDQDFTDFELIIVNDASTDNSLDIITTYLQKDSRIRLINNSTNKRLPESLNAGFAEAKGKYFTWTSDDNYYSKDALQCLYNELNSDNSIDLVYSDFTLIDDLGEITGTKSFNDINLSFQNWKGCGACFLYKAEVHKALKGYIPSWYLVEDFDFFLRAYTKFQFKYMPGVSHYFYRFHESSLTSTQGAMVNDLAKYCIERNLPGLLPKLSEKDITLLYRKLAIFYSVSQNNRLKYQYYLKKLTKRSILQGLITIIYVPILNLYDSLCFILIGFMSFLRSIFTSR